MCTHGLGGVINTFLRLRKEYAKRILVSEAKPWACNNTAGIIIIRKKLIFNGININKICFIIPETAKKFLRLVKVT